MPDPSSMSGWTDTPPLLVPAESREAHVRYCSYFADTQLDRYPQWIDGLDQPGAPQAQALEVEISRDGLDAGLRRYRNRQMLRIIWQDLCGLSPLAGIFSDLTRLAEVCLQAAIDEHSQRLYEKHGRPRDEDGVLQQLIVIGMGKFGGGELNLSSDIDVMFCYPCSGECDGSRNLSNEQFFTRLARAIISSLSDITEDGFCFRVDARLRPFGDSGPLTCSVTAMEQYYQRDGRDWERYALIKARPVAGDLATGAELIRNLRPFIYRRYIDFSSVEALQEMHANVREDARRKDRLDDIKRGPGGIREIEFLAQCFQILRGGREITLQTPELDQALQQIQSLELMTAKAVKEVRDDYIYLRRLENRIQALRDQQTHRLPAGEDLERMALAMGEESGSALAARLATIRKQVSDRFDGIFPSQPAPAEKTQWAERWRSLQTRLQGTEDPEGLPENVPFAAFLRQLERLVMTQRARSRLDRFMPVLLEHIEEKALSEATLNRIFDLVLTTCRRSAYLVLLVQHVPALERMLDLFSRSEWIADKVTRFPALLDELIDPSLGQQIPAGHELDRSVARLLSAAQDTETVLEGLNYLKLATSLRIAVAQLEETLSAEQAQLALSSLASAVLHGVITIAGQEIEARHGRFADSTGDAEGAGSGTGKLAVIAYGTLGASELGYESDLDIVFLFDAQAGMSDGDRSLAAERYYARLAQRALSFLTVITPSGRLYEVDTRLRPNGRAGALVSSFSAFRDYQMKEAWTWEMQALTRARFIAGQQHLKTDFERIRLDALCRSRNEDELRAQLLDMRQKMSRENEASAHTDTAMSPKHCQGGLIDIEFIAQLGILASAAAFPRVLQATGTLAQLAELECIGWLSEAESKQLQVTLRALSRQRMVAALAPNETATAIDTRDSAILFENRMGGSGK